MSSPLIHVDDLASRSEAGHWLLPAGEIHVWQGSADSCHSLLQPFEAMLAADEHARARKFHFQRDRVAFIYARGLLRFLLGSYLGCEPQTLRFTYNLRGKPGLSECNIHFNLSHAHGLMLFAFARDRRVGIDVEFLQRERALTDVVDRHFSERERAEWHALPASLQRQAFYAAWTRKEAYLKAIGEGLGVPLSSFSASLHPQEAPCLRGRLGKRWSLHSFSPAPRYIAALAAEGIHLGNVRCREWIPERLLSQAPASASLHPVV